ncbi:MULTISPECIES: restriction endonuclease subunit S [Gelidibacter]|uniref:Restriction endonuclease subunit S n=1 Tax=Gelidibacter pelagius TaxID=2819985 RepID=A0ABS3SZT3_9FLAO|nr:MULTISPECIES: restriction endonuclease subunit S [Gelidibacter]MBO3100252.1 restriction endonuclease subunit S [Gelidibacter pelagius]
MEKYNKYKDSGIEWLGEIPTDWNIKRIKDIASTKSGTTPQSNNRLYYENGIHNWIRTTDLNNGELYDVEYKITDLAITECRMKFLPIDAVLIAMYGGFGTIGKNAILKKESTINQSVCSVLPNSKKFDSNYLLYFFKHFRNDWRLFADGTRKDPNINQEAVRNLFIYQPILVEQTQIANYLDAKTTAIEKKIKLLQQKTKHYKAFRKTLINETVTKGLDKTVKLKDSGVNWIGEIPDHWEVNRYKSFGKTIKGKNMETSDFKFDHSLPLLSLEYLRKDSVQHPTYCYSTDKSLKSTDDDLIIVWDGAAVGEILQSKLGYVSSTIAKLDIDKKKFNKKYFYHLRGAIDYKLKQIPTGMGIPHLNPTLFKNFQCPTPPLEEQTQIANYLDAKTTTIDNILKNIKTQITTLKELRKTLINEVVTGKVKVSTNLQ